MRVKLGLSSSESNLVDVPTVDREGFPTTTSGTVGAQIAAPLCSEKLEIGENWPYWCIVIVKRHSAYIKKNLSLSENSNGKSLIM